MNSNEVKDVIYSIQNDSYRNQEVNFKFVYNSYVPSETSIDDKTFDIVDKSKSYVPKYRFIRITLENLIFNPQSDSTTSSPLQIELSNILNNLAGKDISSVDREYFNRLDSLTPNRYSLLLDTKLEEFKKFSTLNNNTNDNLSISSFNNNDRSTVVSLKSNKKYISIFKEKEFVEDFNYSNLNSYENLINNEKSVIARKNKDNFQSIHQNGNLFPNLNMFCSSINYGDLEVYARLNGINCGIYIEKFKLNSNTNEFEFLAGRFLNRVNNREFLRVIEDKAVNYGETYRYIIYNTFIFTTVNSKNRFLLNHYILCTHPYISNNLVCKENTRPQPPVSLSGFYDTKLKRMTLHWQSPKSTQGDVKGFQILKRKSLEEPFQLVKQLEGHLVSDHYKPEEIVSQNFIVRTPGYVPYEFVDENFDENNATIYTVRTIDAHGMFSDCGLQSMFFYDYLRSRLIVNVVAESGADVSYPNTTITKSSIFNTDALDVIDNLPMSYKPKKISLYITPDFSYIIDNKNKTKTMNSKYQFTFSNLNKGIYRSDIFTIDNFG